MDQLPRLGKRELICLLLFTCNYVVSVWRGFLFLWVLGMGYVILLWHSLGLPYNYFFIVRTCTFYYKMYTLLNIYIILMYHYIPVGHQDERNINREGLLTLGIAVISIGRV